jgi:hypothetical protein
MSSTSCGFIIIFNRPAASATQSNGNRQLPDPTMAPARTFYESYPILHNDFSAVSKHLQGVPQNHGALYQQQQQVAVGAGGIMMVGGGSGGLRRMRAVLLDDDDGYCSTLGLATIMARCLICTIRSF